MDCRFWQKRVDARQGSLGWRRWLGRLARSTGGMSAVEFALATPILLAVVIPVADLGIAYSQQIQVQQAAQAGAQYALLHGYNSTSITNAVTAATRLSVSASPAPSQTCGCPDGSAITTATCGSNCSNGEAAGSYVTVGASLPYTPVLPYSVLGSSVTLAAQATVRVQ